MTQSRRLRFDLPIVTAATAATAVLVVGIHPPLAAAGLSAVLVVCGSIIVMCLGTAWWACRRNPEAAEADVEHERAVIERLREETLEVLEVRAERLAERERDLTARLVQFQEFLEYPAEDEHHRKTPAELQQLTEQDRQVHELLEAEAERVYQKIRRNEYSRDGVVDLKMIRDEVEELIGRIAKIYQPDSQHPLLETSFEQLARAASRVCLHAVVLLEQLPINVQQYTISDLYRYLRQATAAWETFQKASPWLKHLSRGVYAGRLMSTTNPVALGAWWLATEVGRRGASRLVESWVDRQAVTVLHDLVAVIGVEVASIYGKGFRQRDAAWVEGCELVEVLHAFPPGREALREALNRITRLPLQNEYDRIYLYRCLATQRSSGYRLADSSLLTRPQREAIAKETEDFFGRFVHGAKDDAIREWRTGLEERLDLKLQLPSAGAVPKSSRSELVTRVMASLRDFLVNVIGLSADAAASELNQTSLGRDAPDSVGTTANASRPAAGFQPPDLDPSDKLTTEYLTELARLAARCAPAEDHVIDVICQVGAWFRRSAVEMTELIESQWLTCLLSHARPGGVHSGLNGAPARAVLIERRSTEQIRFTYPRVSREIGDESVPIPDAWLIGFRDPQSGDQRTIVLQVSDGVAQILWTHTGTLTVRRRRSILLDDAEIVGGEWHDPAGSPPLSGSLIVAGSLRGGRYDTYFGALHAE